jgi:heptosyltransferase-1
VLSFQPPREKNIEHVVADQDGHVRTHLHDTPSNVPIRCGHRRQRSYDFGDPNHADVVGIALDRRSRRRHAAPTCPEDDRIGLQAPDLGGQASPDDVAREFSGADKHPWHFHEGTSIDCASMGQGIDLLGSITRVFPEQPPPADGGPVRTVLIVKLSSLGDVVHALPVASALKSTDPSLRITWAVEEWAAPVVAGHRAIDRVVLFPTMRWWPSRPIVWARKLQQAVRELRSESYDVALDLQGLARSAVVTALSSAPRRLARAGQREGAHLVSYGVRLPSEPLHAVDEYLHVASSLGAARQPAVFAIPVSGAARQRVDTLLSSRGVSSTDRLVVVNASAAGSWKRWAPDRWAAVVDGLADLGRVILSGARGRGRVHAEIAQRARRRPVDLTGGTTLEELVALLERAALHVAPDTGTIHLAVALGTPVVGVYGPTPPWRVGPYRQPHSVVYHADQCGATCPAYCLYGRRCLGAVTADEVIASAHEVLASSRASMLGASC